MVRKTALLAAIFAALVAFYLAGLTLVCMIPNGRITGNVSKSFAELSQKYTRTRMAWTVRSSYFRFNDQMMLNMAVRHDKNALRAAMFPTYFRYWHGYVLFLRPLLCFFSLPGLWLLAVLLLTPLLLVCLRTVRRRLGADCAAMLAVTFIATYVWVIPFALSYIPVCVVTLAELILACRLRKECLPYMFFIGASLVNFTDFLTFPLVSLGLPLTEALTAQMKQPGYSMKSGLASVFGNSAAWGAGYALTWMAKWAAAWYVLGGQVFANIASQAVFRSIGNAAHPTSRILAVTNNLTVLFTVPLSAAAAFAAAALVIMKLRGVPLKQHIGNFWLLVKKAKDMTVPLSLVAVSPFIWYLTFANHSQFHARFTFRELAVSIFACLTAADTSISGASPDDRFCRAALKRWRECGKIEKYILVILLVIISSI